MSLLSEFEATPQKGTVGSHMRKKQTTNRNDTHQ